jgi:O-antigen/teichoic acid export membrane protein
MAFQGVYLLTSIGLNLTSRTEFYPVSTITAAVVGLGAGVVLMPRYGVRGAAVALLMAYVTQAAVAFVFARRLYPIRYEAARITRVVIAGIVAALCARWLVPDMPPLAGVFVRGVTTVAVFMALLWMSGFLRSTELAFLREKIALVRNRSPRRAAEAPRA